MAPPITPRIEEGARACVKSKYPKLKAQIKSLRGDCLRLARLGAARACLFTLLAGMLFSISPPVVGEGKPETSLTRLAVVDPIIQQAIHDGQIPGAVVLIGHNGQVVYRKAYGSRALEPRQEVM